MAYELWKTGGLTAEGQLTTFDKRLLSRFRAETIFNRWGSQRGIPVRGGKSISFRRLDPIYGGSPTGVHATLSYTQGMAALTEGTAGAALNATWVEIIATVSQYGQHVAITDLAERQSIDDLVPEYTENFSEAMTEALDLITRDILVAGSNVQWASIAATRGGASGVGSGMYLNLAELREAKRTLLRANAKGVRQEGSKFVVVTHPDALYDLEGDSTIQNAWFYAGSRGGENQIFDVAFRDLPFGFRMYTTSSARIFPSLGLSGADVYTTLVFGEEWYGTIKLNAMPAKIIRKPIGSSGVFDPLDQVGTIGCSNPADLKLRVITGKAYSRKATVTRGKLRLVHSADWVEETQPAKLAA